jgi:hypothetical protein
MNRCKWIQGSLAGLLFFFFLPASVSLAGSCSQPDLIADLIKIIWTDETGSQQRLAAMALGGIGKEAAGQLEKVLLDPRTNPRLNALIAVQTMGPEAADLVPWVARSLKDPNLEVRIQSAYALGRMGVRAQESAPLLFESLDDPNDDVRQFAAQAIREIFTANGSNRMKSGLSTGSSRRLAIRIPRFDIRLHGPWVTWDRRQNPQYPPWDKCSRAR